MHSQLSKNRTLHAHLTISLSYKLRKYYQKVLDLSENINGDLIILLDAEGQYPSVVYAKVSV